MPDDLQPKSDQDPASSHCGNPSNAMASPMAHLHAIQPKSHQQQAAPSGRSRNETYRWPPLRPQSRATQQQQSAKIAIPRLPRDSDGSSAAGSSFLGDKHRVPHACVECRARKTKCSGERPSCKHCQDCKIFCTYADGKRDRTKKQLGNMTERVEEYERLLRELSQRVDGADQMLIQKTLDQESIPDDDETSVASLRVAGMSAIYPGAFGHRDTSSHEVDGEARVSARVGSTRSLDQIHEDYNLNAATRATGFVGKTSELTWMQRLKRRTMYGSDDSDDEEAMFTAGDGGDSTSSHQGQFRSALTPVNESTYHCDDLTVSFPGQVEPHDMPSRQIADSLFQVYLDTVHPVFPIIGKTNFTNQYQRFFEAPNIMGGDSWKAILNLILAIGAKYSNLIQAEWRGEESDHLVYFTRARMLGFNSDSILGHADLQRVQIAGLMSFYLTAVNQINRAWTISGIAIRYGCTLGLNLRNESKKVSDTSKEIRYRVWWALCSNERLLAVRTGRPTSIMDTECSVPLPIPLDEETFFSAKASTFDNHTVQLLQRYSSQESQNTDCSPSTPSSTYSAKSKASPSDQLSPASHQATFDHYQTVQPSHSLYFLHHTKLSILTSQVLTRLYRVDTLSLSWAEIQSLIASFESDLERWRSSLPLVFDFGKRQRDQQFNRQRVSLGFFYYSTLTIICRPCLCRVDEKILNVSEKAKDFNRSTAARCVHAALDMVELLPDKPNAVGLYKVAPWWCLVHHIVQAATILMLELSFQSDHLPHNEENISISAAKAVLWLRSMSEEDLSAYRAWRMCDDMLRKIAPRTSATYLHESVDDMQGVFPIPGSLDRFGGVGTSDDFIGHGHHPGERGEDSYLQPYPFTFYAESPS